MQRLFLKSKLHQARITFADVDYEGSCGISAELAEAADLMESEQIDVYNLDNGERFTTYVIMEERGTGAISLRGAAAHKGAVGDRIIIACYCVLSAEEVRRHKPRLLYLDENNAIARSENLASMCAA